MTTQKETTLQDCDRAAQTYATAYNELANLVQRYKVAQVKLAADHVPAIRKALQAATTKRDGLHALVLGARALFEKPKSQTLHGFKFGYRKGNGRTVFQFEADKTVALIRRHLGEDAVNYIHTVESPDKEALEKLTGDVLKKLGITVEGSGDIAFVQAADSAVDKLVKAVLKNAEEDV